MSVLVRTGVFRGGTNSDSDPAAIVVADVEEAVAAGLHRTRSHRRAPGSSLRARCLHC